MQKYKSQAGSVPIVVVILLVIALVGALGFIFWNNFLKKDSSVAQTDDKQKVEELCAGGENTVAEKSIFCSKEIGIKLTVPSVFAGKFTKIDDYEVFQGSLDPNEKKTAGQSENTYRATISGSDNFTFTIAKEPLRTGYVDVPYKLQNTYYDQVTGDLTLIKAPETHFDSMSNKMMTSGSYSKSEVVPSFTADGIRFFKATSGDAGQTETAYFAVINNKIVKISLKHSAYMGDSANDPATIDEAKIFDELDKSIKTLKTIGI